VFPILRQTYFRQNLNFPYELVYFVQDIPWYSEVWTMPLVLLMHFGAETISSRFLHQWSCNNLYRWFFSPCLIGDENSRHETPRSKAETILKVNAWLSDVMLCKSRISWHVFKERVTSWRQRLENYLGRATLFGFLLAPANRPNSIWTHIRLEVWSVL
jgi:hypothetical protein